MNPTTEPRTRVTDCLLYLSITCSNKTQIVIIVTNRSRLFLHPSAELSTGLSRVVTGDTRNNPLTPETFAFVRNLDFFEVWVCAKFGFVRSLGLFKVWGGG